ncbi:MAG: hypothetical protein K6F45_07425 [Saccharofermentans sp.]|nr:hypothetical protein [Saccharofermentans sp.]
MTHYITDFEVISLFILIALGVFIYTRYSNENEKNHEYKNFTTIVAAACFFDVMASESVNRHWPVGAEMLGYAV